ncbi:MAG: glycosyl hydrolase [Saprospiraceae bacterium]|nr:glycosyl hydrolase [Saprospiraceae bacterium]
MKSLNNILWALCLLLSASALYGQKKTPPPAPAKEVKPEHFLDKVSLGGLKFRNVGPAITSGRIADIAVHPGSRSVYYVAVASGGVWKTENAGTTYEPIFDAQGSYSIGCVTLDPNNPNVVWVGTGENNNQRSVAYGDGVYKSEDGGKSWKNMGLKTSEHIGKIIVDPRNSDVVYVAAIGPLWKEGGERGVYKTTDGGKTWKAVLTVDEHTGATDLLMDPRNPDVLYAAAYQRRRHVFTYVGGGPGSGMYKSKDAGQTWEKINTGLPTVDIGRIGLAMAPSDPEVIYAIVEAAQGKGGFYRSTNRGASWEKRGGHSTSGNYYSEIVVHPHNPDVVYSMDVWIQISNDGGKSFQMMGEEFKHVDNHSMWIDPKDPNYYLVGCDGGIYESFDAAKTWVFKANLPVTQFYKVAVDNSSPFYYIYGGTQDNFSLGGPSRTRSAHGIVNEDWFVTNGGDGFESAIDPKNPNIVYAQAQHGVLVRYDRESGEATGIQPKPGKGEPELRWNWDSPLMTSAHVDKRLYFAANKVFRSDDQGNSWKAISPDLTRQLDRNTLPVMGRIQSMDAVAKNASTSLYGNLVAFHESPMDANLLYVGSDDGLIHISEDGGANWTKVDCNAIPGVPERTYVNYLLASQHDRNVVYAAFNHHKYGDFKPYFYKSSDRGRTWKAMSNNLPERGSVYSIAEDHVDKDLLFVGTEFGCFFTPDGGNYWKALKAGLPTVAVRDITIQKRENDLVLGTFGRGFLVLDDYSALRQVKKDMLAAEAKIFPIKDGLVYHESYPLGLRGKAFQGHAYFTAPNPPVGAAFTYFVKDEVKTLKQKRQEDEKEKIKKGEPIRYPTYEELEAETREEEPYLLFTIRDLSGSIVRELKTGISKGLHRIHWDGRFPSINPVRLQGPAFDNPFANLDEGVLAMPGEYTVSLSQSINGQLRELAAPQRFRLNSLGGVTLPAADRAELVAFQRQAQDLQRVVSGAGSMLGEINNRMQHIRKAIFSVGAPKSELVNDFKAIEAKLYAIRKTMYGDNIAATLDKDDPFTVASRIGWLTGEMWGSTSAPTQTQRDALRIADEEFKPLLEQIRSVRNNDLRILEEKLEKAGAPYTPGRDVKRD